MGNRFKLFIFAFLCAGFCNTALAQVKEPTRAEKKRNVHNRIVLKMPDGKDSLITRVGFVFPKDKYERQTKIGVVDTLGNEVWYTSDQVLYARKERKVYRTVDVKDENGELIRIFPECTYYGQDDNPSVFKIYDKEGAVRYYLQYETDGKLVPMTDPATPGYGNKLVEHLLQKNDSMGGNAEIAEYINRVHPKRKSIKFRLEALRNQNPNLVPHFRWGVGAGVIGTSIISDYSYTRADNVNQAHAMASAFADFAFFGGISFHPELSFQKTAVRTYYPIDQGHEIAFNRTEILVPLMLRYTLTKLRGKILPFAEIGAQVGLPLKMNAAERGYSTDSQGFVLNAVDQDLVIGGTVVSAVGGAGVEYKLSPKHSLFLNARYVFGGNELTSKNFIYHTNKNSYVISLSYNL